MPEQGHYAVCDKSNIWYHPSCEGLDVNEIPKSGISYFCKNVQIGNERKKDNFTVDNHTVFEIEAATTVRSKNGICLLHVSFQFQSKYPSKVSAMKVIDLCFFFRFVFYLTVVAASDFNNYTMINCDLVNKF